MKRVFKYLNPIEQLGSGKQSFLFPLITNFVLIFVSEIYAYGFAHNPMIIGTYIIFLNIAFVIYFSFRDGIIGGVISTAFAVLYYFYIIKTRYYSGQQLIAAIDTILMLGAIYFLLAFIIGWLKQTIDKLIERETNEKIWLQMILQQLAVGVIITDNKGRIVQTNKRLEQILGAKIPSGFILGKDTNPILTYANNEPTNPEKSPLYKTLNSNKPVVGKEFTIKRKDGKNFIVQVDTSVIRNKKNKVIAAASIISDITQQKELERQKDDFLSMASHELKTPITSLKMFIDLQTHQLQEQNPKKAYYYNERIRDQANRLKELTNDLLDVSRIQTNKLHFNTETFNIAQVIRDTVEGLQATTKRHEIIIKDIENQTVKADRYRIYQVLVNLISNAIKYSPTGAKIFVEVKKVKQSVIVSIQDFGIGISQSQHQKIFDRLYQVTDHQEKTFPGLGLGLYISKQIVQRHTGNIWVKSSKGKGATFYFSLPLYANKV